MTMIVFIEAIITSVFTIFKLNTIDIAKNVRICVQAGLGEYNY